MTKADLVKQVAQAANITPAEATRVVESMCAIAAEELAAGREVPLPGIGRLVVKETTARTGRNPRTGEEVQIPAGRRVVLRAGKGMKDALK